MPLSKTIFFIDDDKDDRDIFRFALETIGITATLYCAYDGVNALEQMAMPEFVQPDLIILDLNMPRLDGRGLLARLRERPEYAAVPIVVYSTSAAPADINSAKLLGATCFVTKHSSFPLMCRELQALLQVYGILPTGTL